MILTVDIGNTNIAFGVFDSQDKLSSSFRIETRIGRTKDEYHSHLNSCLEHSKVNYTDLNSVIVSSVVPNAKYEFTEYCKKYLKLTPIFIEDNIDKLGIKIDLNKPEEVGSDRLVNAISASEKHKNQNIIILDFGTATTFDIVDKLGSYIGGVISPGVNLSIEALQKATSKLPKISISKPKNVIGKDTKSAMQSGVYFGYLGLIEYTIMQIKAELKDDKALVITTGGLASFFSSSKLIDKISENLTLEGLNIIYKKLNNK